MIPCDSWGKSDAETSNLNVYVKILVWYGSFLQLTGGIYRDIEKVKHDVSAL